MGWKQWPGWVKGGIIAVLYTIISVGLFWLYAFNFAPSNPDGPDYIALILIIFVALPGIVIIILSGYYKAVGLSSSSIFDFTPANESLVLTGPLRTSITMIITFIVIFLIGAIIGGVISFIAGKIRSKNNETELTIN